MLRSRLNRGAVACIAAALLMLAPSPAFAWGSLAHQFIMGRAIDLLPAELRPFFEANRAELVLRANDPDLWRVAGWDDDASHFLDFGVDEYGPYPFKALPRDYDAAVKRFGQATVRRNGVLPWRVAEMSKKLEQAFQRLGKSARFSSSDVVLFAAITAHYVQDAHQPFHGTIDFDGQKTNQRGIHGRFEAELFERFGSRLSIAPRPASPMTQPRDAMFDVLLESYQLVPRVLDADRRAARGTTRYDNRYYDDFFQAIRPVLERRITESIAATAAVIVGAWTNAGRPALRTAPQPRVRP